MNKIFGLNKNIFTLGLTSFFNDFSNQMILSAFPAFFTSVLKAGAASLGIVEGLADGISNMLKIYSGNLSDRINRRLVFIFTGYSMSVFIRPLYMVLAVFSGIWGVLALRIIDRMGKGIREAPRDVIISISATNGDTGRSFGYHKAMDTAGGILGPIAAFFLLQYWPENWNMFFIVTFIVGLLAIVTIFFVKDVVTARSENGSRLFSLRSLNLLPESFKYYLLAVFILSVGSLPVAVLLLKTTSIGLLIASIPLFYMVYNISSTAFSFHAGKLSDVIGTGRVIILGYLILIISYLGMMWAYSPVTLGLFFALMGIFSACTDATQRAHVAKNIPEHERGTAYGLLNGVVGFGAMVAGVMGGILWQYYGESYALVFASVAVVIGLMIFWWSRHIRRIETRI